MEIRHEIKRLRAIRLKFVIFNKKCDCCKHHFHFTRMWHVKRRGAHNTIFDWYYCKNCTPTAKDVLNEIDTDDVPFGIAFIDDGKKFKKKRSHKKRPGYSFPFIPALKTSDSSYPE